ncbi:hypothetical protein [Streptosporangium sp. NPDC050280]|uniref:hypothetical protein n=1 Tax=unclassified Streptosporangium TaxID=2632669 RepID=UPI00341E7A19
MGRSWSSGTGCPRTSAPRRSSTRTPIGCCSTGFPAYAPELNPAEGVWACLRDKLLNLAVDDIDQLTLVIRSKLKQMQYQPTLLDGFIAETGLPLQPS